GRALRRTRFPYPPLFRSLSHGRAIMNLGAGGGTMKELGYKLAPVKDVRDMIAVGRRLLTGEPVELTVQGQAMTGAKLRFLSRKEDRKRTRLNSSHVSSSY